MARSIETVALEGMGLHLGATFRYALAERIGHCASRRDVAWLGFGFGDETVRLVLRGDREPIRNTIRGIKVGTVRAAVSAGEVLRPQTVHQATTRRLLDAMVWAHQAPAITADRGPLASPWTSHRDVLGFRTAPFYDPSVLGDQIDPEALHRAAGGRRRQGRGRPLGDPGEGLGRLLRIAAGVLGVAPPDRRCFRLFVHLAVDRGWPTAAIAAALRLSGRRIRQLRAETTEGLGMALTALVDPDLGLVP